ncbi:DNA/RNA non-specific endonuclease [Streptomyces sp. NBC_01262]|uniref:DNA/RNA non-specific endonuclease n=1 Tax=Streptomyces sp. NBC_01262 TaxID=2903803 RepID=UPI002E3717F5|nr:DNA/RNA non-specific endonuclease [Streptomyces sp. NBC_01262]
MSPAQQGASAAQALSALPAVNLSMVYAPAEHQSMTRANLTVNSTGQASGTLSEPVAGKSTLAWSGDQLYLKGDSAFWAQQDPLFGTDLTSTGHWVAPEKRSGYYMLDSFGVNAGSLTPASLATLVRQVTSDPEAVRQDDAMFQGRKAVAYTSQGWTVVLAAESPYSVLAIGGDPGGDSPVKTATWHPARRTGPVAEPADYRTDAVPADDSDFSSYLLLEPKPATTEQAGSVRTTTASAVATAVPPATSAEAVAKTMGPEFTITSNDASLCTTNPCSYSYTVTNSGDQAGAATLYLTLPRVPDQPHTLGTLQPKQSKTVSGTRPNIAWGTGRTVNHTDYAWVYSTAEYGSDPKVGSRLHARNLQPDDLSFGTPLKPTVAKLLDLMTKDRPTSDTEAGSKAVDAVEGANDQGELPDLGEIVDSGRLDNPQDLRDILPTTDKVENQRVLQQIALLLQADPQAHVTWTAPPTAGGTTPPADYLYTTTEQGRQVKRAVKTETVRSPAELGSQARLGAAQLNGEQPDSGTAGGQKVRSGYERVLRLDLEPFVGPLLNLATTQDLEHSLSTDPQFRQLRDSLCEPNGGVPRVDRLVIVNAAGTHQWTSPRQLGARCGSGTASASPDPSSSSSPAGKPTCLTQTFPRGSVERNGPGWINYAPLGPHNRASAATACLKLPVAGDGTAPSTDNIAGLTEAQNRATALFPLARGRLVERCHLIPRKFNGRGVQRNIAPCWRTPVNVGEMTDIANAVSTYLNKGETVLMTVACKYKDSAAEIPYEFIFQATAWDSNGNQHSLPLPLGGTVQNVKSGKNLSP